MRFSIRIMAAFGFALPSLACLRVYGGITHDPLPDLSGVYGVTAVDDGVTTCSVGLGDVTINQGGNYEMPCIPGYHYSFTQDGAEGFYSNPTTLFNFGQGATATEYCCDGPCGQKGAHLTCTDYNWDVTNYC